MRPSHALELGYLFTCFIFLLVYTLIYTQKPVQHLGALLMRITTMAPLQTSLSTLWLGVLLLAPGLATALVPACLVGLGPEFCPGTGVDARFEKNGTRANSSFIAPAELTLETVLKDELFPRMVRTLLPRYFCASSGRC